MSNQEWKALKEAFESNLKKYTKVYGSRAEAPVFKEHQQNARKWRELGKLASRTQGGSIWQC